MMYTITRKCCQPDKTLATVSSSYEHVCDQILFFQWSIFRFHFKVTLRYTNMTMEHGPVEDGFSY